MPVTDAPPYSIAEISDGRTWFDVNSAGNEDADSFRVLSVPHVQDSTLSVRGVKEKGTNCRRAFFSVSLAREKLLNSVQTLISRFVAKKPVSTIPMSRKAFGVSRVFGLGFRRFLNDEKRAVGIAPRDVAAGGG